MHIFLTISVFILPWVTMEIEENIYFGPKKHIFKVGVNNFLLDGNEFIIYAGEIHYFRIPQCKWMDRMRKLQNAGFNTVSTAIEWATHEPSEGVFNWQGEANLTDFVKIAYELNIFVIVRAGPYVGIDRELGGLPSWLHHTNGSFRRTVDIDNHTIANYKESVVHWLSHLLSKINVMMISQGGPIIMVQIDSDIGEFGDCTNLEWLYDIFLSYLGNEAVLFTMEENDIDKLVCGSIEGAIRAIRVTPHKYVTTYGKSTARLFYNLRTVLRQGPKLVELRTGFPWKWGGQRLTFELNDFFETMSDIITSKSSFIIYMFAGGTNFNHAGYISNDTKGLITSYDYDGVLNEAGDFTKKYAKIQEMLGVSYNTSNSIVKERRALYEPPNFILVGSFIDSETRKIMNVTSFQSKRPLTFGEIGISEGMVVYETSVPKGWKTKNKTVKIQASGVRDRGYVYVDNIFYGIFDRTHRTIVIARPSPRSSLKILVESYGYISCSDCDNQKGIFTNVYLEYTLLANWTIHPIPLNDTRTLENAINTLSQKKDKRTGHGLYRGIFTVPEYFTKPLDTFLDISKFQKGLVYLNQFSIGRYWPTAGPQHSLYIPNCFIKPYPHRNIFLIIEMHKNPAKEEIQSNFMSKTIDKPLRGISGYNQSPKSPAIVICTMLMNEVLLILINMRIN